MKPKFRYARPEQVCSGMVVCVSHQTVSGVIYRTSRRKNLTVFYVRFRYENFLIRSRVHVSNNERVLARIPSARAESGL